MSALGGPASIAEAFDPNSIAARFVVSMSMAKNDVECALRDATRAACLDDPDLDYRVRLAVGHLFEGFHALNRYATHNEVKQLMKAVPKVARGRLKEARGLPHQLGSGVLEHARNHVFHYPAPPSREQPLGERSGIDRDGALGQALDATGTEPAELHFAATGEVRLLFADRVALYLALGRLTDPKAQLGSIREAGGSFAYWAGALAHTYLEQTGAYVGNPA